jgi:hypothetical protein
LKTKETISELNAFSTIGPGWQLAGPAWGCRPKLIRTPVSDGRWTCAVAPSKLCGMKTDLVILDCVGVLIESEVISARIQVAPPGLALDTALILGGLSLQRVLAFVRDRLALKTW